MEQASHRSAQAFQRFHMWDWRRDGGGDGRDDGGGDSRDDGGGYGGGDGGIRSVGKVLTVKILLRLRSGTKPTVYIPESWGRLCCM